MLCNLNGANVCALSGATARPGPSAVLLSLFIKGSKALRQRETAFIDTISDTIDLSRENVVHDDGDGRSTDTQSCVVQGLGDTFGQFLRSFTTTAITQGRE